MPDQPPQTSTLEEKVLSLFQDVEDQRNNTLNSPGITMPGPNSLEEILNPELSQSAPETQLEITKAEYDDVKVGMTYNQVKGIVGSPGQEISSGQWIRDSVNN